MTLTPGPAVVRKAPGHTSSIRQVLLALVLVCVSMFTSALVVDWTRAPDDQVQAGDIAPRTIKSPVTFKYQDLDAYEERRLLAREAVLPVFVSQPGLREEMLLRTRMAFANARAILPPQTDVEVVELERQRSFVAIADQLQRDLRVQLVREDVRALIDARFDRATESLTLSLLGDAMNGLLLVDRSHLPRDRGIRVVTIGDETEASEHVESDLASIRTAAFARQQIRLQSLEASFGTMGKGNAATAVARALVRANLTFSPIETKARQEAALQNVRLQPVIVKRGTVLFREGDTLSSRDIMVYRALQAQQGEQTIALEWLAVTLFLMFFIGTTAAFGRTQLENFSIRLRNVWSASGLLLLTIGLARVTVATAPDITALIGYEAQASSVWFVVPVAGAAMLIRLLMGLSWSVLFTCVSSVIVGLTMDLSLLPVMFFLLSGFTGAASVAQTHERIGILRAGMTVALVNAVAALFLHFVQLYVVDGEVTASTAMRPVWSMLFALGGGLLSSFMVLGLTPLFETFGFVTDYRLMELANLNHPLMRQLMLRAPGSYHHSVMVGSLSEAGAEAVGANALQAKVASYFHDIGKSLKPQYFVENQGKGGNRHEGLEPHMSAQIIISHVTEGGRLAIEHKLPKPIQDNIWMHHGTGILQYFYAKASERAGRPLDEAPFRYPGPKPNSREAGIIMLADKIEAATRTIKVPNEQNIRAMIQRIVNSVMADGQFSECPLTFQEIHTVIDTFVTVLLGIYHQRIEYPQTANISQSDGAETPSPSEELKPRQVLKGSPTQPIQEERMRKPVPSLTLGDYESVQHLPSDEGSRK